MDSVAPAVADALDASLPDDSLLGVSYYDADGTETVYASEHASEAYDVDQVETIVDDLRLESLARGAHEQRHGERLHATARLYDSLLNVVVPLTDAAGIVVGLDVDGAYRTREVVSVVEEAADEASGIEREPVSFSASQTDP